jgi:hypothetical protein
LLQVVAVVVVEVIQILLLQLLVVAAEAVAEMELFLHLEQLGSLVVLHLLRH